MQEKFNDATPNRPQGERPIDSPLLLIDLPELVKQIKSKMPGKKMIGMLLQFLKQPVSIQYW